MGKVGSLMLVPHYMLSHKKMLGMNHKHPVTIGFIALTINLAKVVKTKGYIFWAAILTIFCHKIGDFEDF